MPKKSDKKPSPKMLGTGMARKAGGILSGRRRSIDDIIDASVRGPKKGKK